MALILTTAFVVAMALAIPNPVDSLLPRDYPPVLGVWSGTPFADHLTFKTYKQPDCKGDPSATYTGSYGFYEANQMQSYHLSRHLVAAETLDFFYGPVADEKANHILNDTLDGHYTLSCLQFDASAGVNASTDDVSVVPSENHGKAKGCHALIQREWCANIWLTE